MSCNYSPAGFNVNPSAVLSIALVIMGDCSDCRGLNFCGKVFTRSNLIAIKESQVTEISSSMKTVFVCSQLSAECDMTVLNFKCFEALLPPSEWCVFYMTVNQSTRMSCSTESLCSLLREVLVSTQSCSSSISLCAQLRFHPHSGSPLYDTAVYMCQALLHTEMLWDVLLNRPPVKPGDAPT